MMHFPFKSGEIEKWDNFTKVGVANVSKVMETSNNVENLLILVQRYI